MILPRAPGMANPALRLHLLVEHVISELHWCVWRWSAVCNWNWSKRFRVQLKYGIKRTSNLVAVLFCNSLTIQNDVSAHKRITKRLIPPPPTTSPLERSIFLQRVVISEWCVWSWSAVCSLQLEWEQGNDSGYSSNIVSYKRQTLWLSFYWLL